MLSLLRWAQLSESIRAVKPVQFWDAEIQGGLDSMLGESPLCAQKGSDKFTLRLRLKEKLRLEEATGGLGQSVVKSQRVW